MRKTCIILIVIFCVSIVGCSETTNGKTDSEVKTDRINEDITKEESSVEDNFDNGNVEYQNDELYYEEDYKEYEEYEEYEDTFDEIEEYEETEVLDDVVEDEISDTEE